jgi:hypothetical protein
MELAMTLPILGIVLLALFEFCVLFFARGTLVEACRIGARKATLSGIQVEQIEDEVRKVLAPHLQSGLVVEASSNGKSGDVVVVAVRVPMSAAAPDLLWPVGITLEGRYLYAETRMIKE